MIACSYNPALWQPESSQSRQEGIREPAASFLRGRGCPKVVAAKSSFSDFLGRWGHLQDSLKTNYWRQHNPLLKLDKGSGKVMETNQFHQKGELFQYKYSLTCDYIGWQRTKQVTTIFVNSLQKSPQNCLPQADEKCQRVLPFQNHLFPLADAGRMCLGLIIVDALDGSLSQTVTNLISLLERRIEKRV